MYYVYGWYLQSGECFYIGKGTGDRWRRRYWKKRNRYFTRIIEKEEKNGRSVYSKKLYENLGEREALLLEQELINKINPKANIVRDGVYRIHYAVNETFKLERIKEKKNKPRRVKINKVPDKRTIRLIRRVETFLKSIEDEPSEIDLF